MNELKTLLLQASDAQIDARLHPLIEKWSDPPTAIQILEVLDWCIYGALGSGFVVTALQVFYDISLGNEGKTHEDMVSLAVWRKRYEGDNNE